MSWFTYILECGDGSLYVGITNNVKGRVRDHNLGEGPAYTKARRPVKVVYTEKHANKFEARKREEQIKKWRREKKLTLIRGLPRTK